MKTACLKLWVLPAFIFLLIGSAQCQTINVNIEWTNSIREISDFSYGVNSPANFTPYFSSDIQFMDNLELITQKKGLIRLHGWGMIEESSPESWLSNGEWNSDKIQQALQPLVQQGYEVMINIPSGPLGEDDYQDPAAFAQFCAELVQIVNIDHQLGIKYWEIPNEREQDFTTPGLSVGQMSILIQSASQSMKTIDPSIFVGGAAMAWINIDFLTQLVEATPEIDFISCHTYSGDCNNSLQDVYDVAQYAVEDLMVLRQSIDIVMEDAPLPIFLTEYNLSYQGCEDIHSNEGAVYDAIIMTESMKSGIDGTCYWNIAPYSDMSVINGDILEGNAYLFEAFNKYFHGDMVQNASSDSTRVLTYATIDMDSNRFSFCLINRTASIQNVEVQMSGLLPDSLNRYLWDEQNSYFTEPTNWLDLNNGSLMISPYSVNLYSGHYNVLGVSGQRINDELLYYPNPTNGIVNLSMDDEIQTYMLYSAIGILVKKGKVNDSKINLSELYSGVYMIACKNRKGQVIMIKVLKK